MACACPQCGWSPGRVRAEWAGKRVRCKQCSAVWRLPDDLAPAAAESECPPPAVVAIAESSVAKADVQGPAAVVVNVQPSARNALSVAAVVFATISLFLIWVPVLGLILTAMGVLFGVGGFVLAL